MENKRKISAKIVADSINQQGDRLTSLLITFPRIILAEVNTHRMLSKNTSSSRAIPFKKMVEAVQNDPFIPIAFQKHHSGMQGSEYISTEEGIYVCKRGWLEARDNAIKQAQWLYSCNVTKQLCNRLLEPFMWTTMLITGSKEGWDNFFNLRCPQYFTPVSGEGYYAKSWKELKSWHSNPENEKILENADVLFKLHHNKGQAEIHMMALAEEIYDAMNESTPKQLEPGEWHIPFGDDIDNIAVEKVFNKINIIQPASLNWYIREVEFFKVKISTAMAARTSYTVVGDEKEMDYERMIGLHDRLIAQNPPHSSPMEHCARAMSDLEYVSWIKGQPDMLEYEKDEIAISYFKTYEDSPEAGWCRNFKGFIPYRHIIETDKN